MKRTNSSQEISGFLIKVPNRVIFRASLFVFHSVLQVIKASCVFCILVFKVFNFINFLFLNNIPSNKVIFLYLNKSSFNSFPFIESTFIRKVKQPVFIIKYIKLLNGIALFFIN